MSAATIRQIQKEYFDLLECYFAEERKEFEKAHISGWEKVLEYVGHDIAPRFKSGLTVQDSELGSVPSILYTVYQLLTGVRAFWSHIGDTLHSAILTSEALCCEITDSDPLETERHIKSHGLYFDTVCFKDPLYHLVRTFHPRQAASLYSFGLGAFFQYFLLISRKQLFVNESDFPIAVLYPEVSSEELLSEVEKNAYEKTRVFASELCDKEFSDPPEIVAHFGSCSFQNTYSRIKAGPLAMFCADL